MRKKLKIIYLFFVLFAIVVYFLQPELNDHRFVKSGAHSTLFAVSYLASVLYAFVLEKAHLDIALIVFPLFLLSLKRITNNNEVPVIYLSAFFLFTGAISYSSVNYFDIFTDHYSSVATVQVSDTAKFPPTSQLHIIDGPDKNFANYSKFLVSLPVLYYTTPKDSTAHIVGYDRINDNYAPATEVKTIICLLFYLFYFFMLLYCLSIYKYLTVSFRI